MDLTKAKSNELSNFELSLASELFSSSDLSSFDSEPFATRSYSTELSQCSNLSYSPSLCSKLTFTSEAPSTSYSLPPFSVNNTTTKNKPLKTSRSSEQMSSKQKSQEQNSSEQIEISKNEPRSSRKKSFARFIKDSNLTHEEILKRRAKNTEAARRSRKRKADEKDNLAKKVSELTEENNTLKTNYTVLEIEKKSLEEKNVEKDKRIKKLEGQLAEAHQKIIDKYQ
ncbi:hypothetical protein C1645_837395 [Glomus cerebriforme]|uniref:BZIP domain-containing protein n=1 Tax=Glomus cerebriforme TaxID=658196 RepID=A0A397SFI2_9GLOM|nr:hypothetical protein C1645_837395 [Glomus cerebriforme]